MMSNETKQMIKAIKSEHLEKSNQYYNFFLAFLGIFVVDVLIILLVRGSNMTSVAWIGIWCLIVAMALTFKFAWDNKQMAKAVTNFMEDKGLK